jgi:6-phosphogluconolactonase/glucosamine-6-phosphate isomerase/deaminase
MGMKSILEAGEIMLLACFEEQKRPLAEIRCGRVTPYLPASYLLKHNNSTIVVSKEKINL